MALDAFILGVRLIYAHARAQMQYRTSFALAVFGVILFSLLDLVVIIGLFHNIPELSGWTQAEVAFLYASSMFSYSLVELLIGQLDRLPYRIRDGSFDVVFVRPQGILFQAATSGFGLSRVGRTLQAALVFGYILPHLDVVWGIGHIVTFVAMIAAGVVIFGSIWIATVSVAFWTVEARTTANAFTSGGLLASEFPVDIYRTWLKRVFIYLVPVSFVSYFPAALILGKTEVSTLSQVGPFVSPMVAVAAAIISLAIWRIAVRHYQSAGG